MMPGATRYTNFNGDRFGGISNGQMNPWENEGPAGYRGSFNMEDQFQAGNFRNGGFQNPPPMKKKPSRVQSGYDSYEEEIIERVVSRMVGKQNRAPKPSFQPRQPMPNNQARNVPQFRNNQYSQDAPDYQTEMQHPQSRPSFQPRRQMPIQKASKPRFAQDQLSQAILEYQNEMQSAPRPQRNPQGWQGHPGFVQQQDNRSPRPQREQYPTTKQSFVNRLQNNQTPVFAPGYQNKRQNFNNNNARFTQVQDNRRPVPNNRGKFQPAPTGYIKSVNQSPKTPKIVPQKYVPAKRPKLATSSKAFKPPQKKKPLPQKAAQPKLKGKPVQQEQPAETKKRSDSQIEESARIVVPLEALKCHVCNVDSFATKKAFHVHKTGETHKAILEAYNAKRDSQLEYLSSCSKLSMLRNGAKLTRELGEKPSKIPKSVEKCVYDNYKRVNTLNCCGEKFGTYDDLEWHKLHPLHLTKEFSKISIKNEENGEEVSTEGEGTLPSLPRAELTKEKVLELIEAAKGDCEVPKNSHLFPVYDPNVMLGLNYVTAAQEWRLFCTVCHASMMAAAMPGHTQSERHHASVIKHFEDVNKKVIEEKKAEKKRQEKIENGDSEENATEDGEEVASDGEEVPKEQRRRKADEEDKEDAESDLD